MGFWTTVQAVAPTYFLHRQSSSSFSDGGVGSDKEKDVIYIIVKLCDICMNFKILLWVPISACPVMSWLVNMVIQMNLVKYHAPPFTIFALTAFPPEHTRSFRNSTKHIYFLFYFKVNPLSFTNICSYHY